MSDLQDRVDWTPLVPGGENFSTHALVSDAGGARLRKSWGSLAVGGAVIALGTALIVVGVFLVMQSPVFTHVSPIIVGGFIKLAGWLYLRPKTIRFDGTTRVISLGRRAIPFADVASLQVVREQVAGEFSSYELNLVLQNGARLNVVDHSALDQLREEAARLGALIGCPVWERAPERGPGAQR